MQNRLKPMSARDILDSTFAIMRERFWTLQWVIFKAFLPSFLILLSGLILGGSFILIFAYTSRIPIDSPQFWTQILRSSTWVLILGLLFLVIVGLAFVIALIFGGIYFVYGSVTVFRCGLHNLPCPAKEVFAGIKGKKLRLFLVNLLVGIGIGLITLPGSLAAFLVRIYISAVIGQIISFINSFVIHIGLNFLVCLAPVIAVVEDRDVIKIISRAFHLPAKHRLRVFGTLVLVYLLSIVIWLIVIGLLAIPVVIAITLRNIGIYIVAGLFGIGILLVFTIFMSYTFGPLTALYYDLIIRKEGYDLQLQLQETENHSGAPDSEWSMPQ